MKVSFIIKKSRKIIAFCNKWWYNNISEEIKMFDIETVRHSLAHVMAYAVQELYKDVKFGIGPAIENGFYYDFDVEKPFEPEDLQKIEDKRFFRILQKKRTSGGDILSVSSCSITLNISCNEYVYERTYIHTYT